MAKRTKTRDSVDVLSDATYQMLEGNVDGQTYADTVLSAFDDSNKYTRPRTYIRGLKRFRRTLLDNIVKQVDKAYRINKNIKMVEKLLELKENK